jgi:hypothetical protein
MNTTLVAMWQAVTESFPFCFPPHVSLRPLLPPHTVSLAPLDVPTATIYSTLYSSFFSLQQLRYPFLSLHTSPRPPHPLGNGRTPLPLSQALRPPTSPVPIVRPPRSRSGLPTSTWTLSSADAAYRPRTLTPHPNTSPSLRPAHTRRKRTSPALRPPPRLLAPS